MKRFITWVFLVVFMATSFGGVFSATAEQAEAAGPTFTQDEVKNASFTWINRASIDLTIGSTKIRFIDRDIGDLNDDMEAPGYDCHAELNYDRRNPGKARVDFDYKETGPIDPTCVNYPGNGGKRDITVSNTSNYNIFYVLQRDRKSIQRADGNSDWTFSATSDPKLYLRNDEKGDKCRDTMVVDLAASTFKLYELNDNNGTTPPSEVRATSGCKYDNTPDLFEVKNDASYPLGRLDDPDAPPTPVSGNDEVIDENAGEGAKTCEGENDQDKLAWIQCSVLRALDSAISFLTKEVDGLLNVDADYYSNSTVKEVWARFRNLAYIILVPIILVMVIGTALGVGPFDAYGVRKALPRMIAAVIFIALSWNITQFGIELVNVLGGGINGLVASVGSGSGVNSLTSLYANPESNNALFTAVAAGAAGFTVAAVSLPILLSVAVTAAIALAVGYLLLTLRVMILILLVVLAPLAILPWIFPGNDKLWKIWRTSFVNLLLVYPLIMMLIGAGQLFAFVINSAAEKPGDGTFVFLGTILAFVAPFFFIPAAFKFAGGVFGTLAGMANDRSKGIFDRQKKFRAEKAASNLRDFKNGERFNPNSKATRFLGGAAVNRVGSNIGAGAKGRYGFGKTGAAARANNQSATADGFAKENSAFAAQVNNEDTMAAVMAGNDRRLLSSLTHFQKKDANGNVMLDRNGRTIADEDKINSAMAGARTIGITARSKTAAAEALAKSGKVITNRAEANKMYSSAAGGNYDASTDTVQGGNASLRGAVKGNYQFTSRQVGRADIGRDDDYQSLRELSLSDISRLKPQAMENLMPVINSVAQSGTYTDGNGNTRAVSADERQHMIDVLYAAENSQNTTPQQQAEIAQAAAAVQAGPNGQAMWAQATANYRNKMQTGTPGTPPGPTPPPPAPSDSRLKRNINFIMRTEKGISLYEFQYIWSDQVYVGVMAQDLIETNPEAVLVDENGYYKVDYGMLGLKMMTIQEWQESLEPATWLLTK